MLFTVIVCGTDISPPLKGRRAHTPAHAHARTRVFWISLYIGAWRALLILWLSSVLNRIVFKYFSGLCFVAENVCWVCPLIVTTDRPSSSFEAAHFLRNGQHATRHTSLPHHTPPWSSLPHHFAGTASSHCFADTASFSGVYHSLHRSSEFILWCYSFYFWKDVHMFSQFISCPTTLHYARRFHTDLLMPLVTAVFTILCTTLVSSFCSAIHFDFEKLSKCFSQFISSPHHTPLLLSFPHRFVILLIRTVFQQYLHSGLVSSFFSAIHFVFEKISKCFS